jgi:hypothetical protein
MKFLSLLLLLASLPLRAAGEPEIALAHKLDPGLPSVLASGVVGETAEALEFVYRVYPKHFWPQEIVSKPLVINHVISTSPQFRPVGDIVDATTLIPELADSVTATIVKVGGGQVSHSVETYFVWDRIRSYTTAMGLTSAAQSRVFLARLLVREMMGNVPRQRANVRPDIMVTMSAEEDLGNMRAGYKHVLLFEQEAMERFREIGLSSEEYQALESLRAKDLGIINFLHGCGIQLAQIRKQGG